MPAFEKVVEQVRLRRVPISDIFRDFDRHRKGICPIGKFFSGLSMLSIQLSYPEMESLAKHYSVDSENVRYREFVSQVENELIQSDVISKPLARPLPDDLLPSSDPRHALDETSEAEYNKVIDKIQTFVKIRRVQPSTFFDDLGKKSQCRMKCGHVTSHQFDEAISRCGIRLFPHEYKILHRKYGIDTDMDPSLEQPFKESMALINYTAFCDDVEDYRGGDFLQDAFERTQPMDNAPETVTAFGKEAFLQCNVYPPDHPESAFRESLFQPGGLD
eukprot:Rmarinus@m.28240